MKILLSGGSGFVGHYVKEALPCIELADSQGLIDLSEADRLENKIREDVPDYVIHLAAQSSVPESFQNPQLTFESNFTGTYNLLSSLERAGFKGKFLYVSSSDVYGLVPAEEQPIKESNALKPRSPYAVSKVAAEALCYQWSQTGAFECVIARPFNHIGPGQDTRFVVPDFAKQLVDIKLAMKPAEIFVGDIDVSRDFTDVRDVVMAYQLLLEEGKNGEVYNICSENSRTIRSILDNMIEIIQVEVSIKQDESRLRKSEQRVVCGDNSKINKMLGWKPRIDMNDTLSEIVKYWKKLND